MSQKRYLSCLLAFQPNTWSILRSENPGPRLRRLGSVSENPGPRLPESLVIEPTFQHLCILLCFPWAAWTLSFGWKRSRPLLGAFFLSAKVLPISTLVHFCTLLLLTSRGSGHRTNLPTRVFCFAFPGRPRLYSDPWCIIFSPSTQRFCRFQHLCVRYTPKAQTLGKSISDPCAFFYFQHLVHFVRSFVFFRHLCISARLLVFQHSVHFFPLFFSDTCISAHLLVRPRLATAKKKKCNIMKEQRAEQGVRMRGDYINIR